MHSRVAWVVLVGLLVVSVDACQEPSGSAGPARSEAPGGSSPVAPAIEPEPSGLDPVIKPPASVRPIAPAIEPEPTGPDPTVQFDGY